MDIIETKIYKRPHSKPREEISSNKIQNEFKSKGIDFINLDQVIKEDAHISSLPHNIKQVNLW